MSLLYNFFIYTYLLAIHISAFFNAKAKKWVQGRKQIFRQFEKNIDTNKKIIWFHCASLGEFEQGRPVMEAFREKHPEFKILVTFFSPSGYEIRKNYKGADYIFYLPMDTRRNARRFIRFVHPELVFFIKYEFWFNYLNYLKINKIPVFLVSGIFRPSQHFFQIYGGWFRRRLQSFSYFFVQNPDSMQLLHRINLESVIISGDTRFDRVFSIASQAKDFPLVKQFAGGNQVFLAGSSWPADEILINELVKQEIPGLKFIIAPHEVHPEHINALLEMLPKPALKFSEANEENIHSTDILVVDSIGILSGLYRYATMAYIGGGFGKGIHNILEAATFGIPVIFGTQYHKFQEAIDLIALNGAFTIKTATELQMVCQSLLFNNDAYQKSADACRQYVENNRGATDKVLSVAEMYLK